MIYLLDTNALSDLMRERPGIDARLAALPPQHQVVICSIVRGELLHGLARLPEGKRRRELEAKAANLLSTVSCEPVSPTAGDHYARVKIARQKQGVSLDENDLWIASTALALGAVLVTRDTDLQHPIDGLSVEDWTA